MAKAKYALISHNEPIPQSLSKFLFHFVEVKLNTSDNTSFISLLIMPNSHILRRFICKPNDIIDSRIDHYIDHLISI